MLAANIALANQKDLILNALTVLMADYKTKGDIYCFTPEKQDAYIVAQEVFK